MTGEERDFFRKIKRAIISNPFSSDRLHIDLELTGMTAEHSSEEILGKLMDRVEKSVNRFLARAEKNPTSLNEEDSHLLQSGILFRVFHHFCDFFDDHIRQQEKRGSEPQKVEFAKDFFTTLKGYGFSSSDTSRIFSLFFQMRRAWFFISRITGESNCVRELRKRLWNNIFTYDIELYDKHLWNRLEDFSTMLVGETGTGKGLAAAAIGRSGYIPFNEKMGVFSESFSKTFISINLSQFPEQLIESELFGHKKGAFTGASETHKGVFSRCSPHGAIFLDEIGDVSVPVQIKLLQVLQERTFTPVGSRNSERFQGRVIAATNKSLSILRKEGEMRNDFYYRLCSDLIEVPPLNQRLDENQEELKIILTFIVDKILGKPSQELTDGVYSYILTNQPTGYPWQGNIRELEQCVRRILISNSYSWEETDEVDDESGFLNDFKNGNFTAQQLLSSYCSSLHKQFTTYEAVAKITGLDRRTVKKHIVKPD